MIIILIIYDGASLRREPGEEVGEAAERAEGDLCIYVCMYGCMYMYMYTYSLYIYINIYMCL